MGSRGRRGGAPRCQTSAGLLRGPGHSRWTHRPDASFATRCRSNLTAVSRPGPSRLRTRAGPAVRPPCPLGRRLGVSKGCQRREGEHGICISGNIHHNLLLSPPGGGIDLRRRRRQPSPSDGRRTSSRACLSSPRSPCRCWGVWKGRGALGIG